MTNRQNSQLSDGSSKGTVAVEPPASPRSERTTHSRNNHLVTQASVSRDQLPNTNSSTGSRPIDEDLLRGMSFAADPSTSSREEVQGLPNLLDELDKMDKDARGKRRRVGKRASAAAVSNGHAVNATAKPDNDGQPHQPDAASAQQLRPSSRSGDSA